MSATSTTARFPASARSRRRHRGLRRGVGQRVGHQVADHLPQPGVVAVAPPAGPRPARSPARSAGPGRPPGPPAPRPTASTGSSTGASASGRSRSSRASSSRSSTSSPIRAASSSIRRSRSAVCSGARGRALPVQLGEAADGGQRGPQLVRGVRDELPHPLLGAPGPRLGRLRGVRRVPGAGLRRAGGRLRGGAGGEGGLDLGQHRVQRPGQPAQLGGGARPVPPPGRAPAGSGRRRRSRRRCARSPPAGSGWSARCAAPTEASRISTAPPTSRSIQTSRLDRQRRRRSGAAPTRRIRPSAQLGVAASATGTGRRRTRTVNGSPDAARANPARSVGDRRQVVRGRSDRS